MNLLRHYKVYVIIVTYNGSTWISKCLSSLQRSTYPVNCIVVDNRSSDNSTEIISQNFPEVNLIRSSTNLGFGKANNIGITTGLEAGGDYFFLLNQDTWIEENTIETLVQAIEENPEFGVVSPLHFDGTQSNLDQGFKTYLLKQYTENDVNDFLIKRDNCVHESDFINAAAWMVSRNCLEKVGGFGYIFYHYGEDRDYVQRMKWLGVKLGFVTNARIYHDRALRLTNELFQYNKKLKYYLVGCIARCTDLNHSFINRLIFSLMWMFKELTVLLFKTNNLRAPILFFDVLTRFLFSIFSIIEYRKYLRRKFKFAFLDFNVATS